MNFEWDNHKNALNIERHGIDFIDVHLVFNRPMIRHLDNRKDYGEKRWVSLGELFGAVVVVVYTMRWNAIRIISVRRANRYERKIYEEKFGKQN
jgi:uncharacterized DUF497 family protein